MHELKNWAFEMMEPLFADLAEFNLSVAAVIERKSSGRIWVDAAENPCAGFLISPEGAYLAGSCADEGGEAGLKEVIPFGAYLIADPEAWGEKLGRVWCNQFARGHGRSHYLFREKRLADWRERIPDGFAVVGIDAELLSRQGLGNVGQVHEWIEDSWEEEKRFLKSGFGFCTMHGERIVSWCLADCVSGERCEIGIDSDPEYRRRGLASATVAATVDLCIERGLTEIGWHCLETNSGSQRVAEKVGFELERKYRAFSSGYPAENAGDLNREEWLGWAAYYHQAAEKERMFRYGEVECLTQAGEEEGALRVLQQMVDDGWDCPIGWLRGHWAFAGLHGTDGWERLILRIEAAEEG